MAKASVRDAEVEGKRVLLRADLNVPLEDGAVADDTRIKASLPTIELLRERGAAIVLVSHLGRPEGQRPEPVDEAGRERLGELLGAEVTQAPAVVGDEVEAMARSLERRRGAGAREQPLRAGRDRRTTPSWRRRSPRSPTSTSTTPSAPPTAPTPPPTASPSSCPAYAGLLLERELEELTKVRDEPERPLVVVLGGAKVTDKIGVIERFLDTADEILIGGAMCFSFFKAEGRDTGDSLVDDDSVEAARELLPRAERAKARLHLPEDLVLGREFDADTEVRELNGVDVPEGWMGLDIGTNTAAKYAKRIARGRHRLLERPDGGLRAGAVRGRHPGGRRGGRRGPRRTPSSAAATRPRRWSSSASTTTSTGSRPAAAPRSSSSRARSCPGWRRCRRDA